MKIAPGDYDGDGRLDFALVSSVFGEYWLFSHVTVMLNNGDSSFREAPDAPDLYDDFAYASVTQSDLNRDGRSDLVLAGQESGGWETASSTAILLNRGDSAFIKRALPLQSRFVRDAGDVNGDGNPDVAASTPADLVLLMGVGDGTFVEPRPLGVGRSGSFVFADFDRDGSTDLAAAGDDRTSILVGNGDGNFKKVSDLPGPSGKLAVGRFVSGGALDLIVGGRLYPGRGDGTFDTPLELYPQDQEWTLTTTADLNGDAQTDIVLISGGNVRVLLAP
jgi:hypothetical protein